MVKNSKLKIKDDWAKRIWRETLGDEIDSQSRIAKSVADIEKQLVIPSETEFGVYNVRTESLAIYLSRSAIKAFETNDLADGWQLIADSQLQHLASFKIRHAMGFPNGTALDLNSASLLYCTAIVFKCRSVAEWLARFIYDVAIAEKSKLRAKSPSDFQVLCNLFASETCAEKSKTDWRNQLQESLYSPLLEAESPDEVQAAIRELAVERGKLCFDSFIAYPPFEWPPYNLFPIDILSILVMRNLDQIKFDFGCMESPLCHPPAQLVWSKPELLTRVEARVREKFSYPEVDWE